MKTVAVGRGTQFQVGPIHEPAAQARSHSCDAAGVAAQVEDKALRLEVLLNRIAERLHDPQGVEEEVEVEVSNVAVDLAVLEVDVRGRELTELNEVAPRFCQSDGPGD